MKTLYGTKNITPFYHLNLHFEVRVLEIGE